MRPVDPPHLAIDPSARGETCEVHSWADKGRGLARALVTLLRVRAEEGQPGVAICQACLLLARDDAERVLRTQEYIPYHCLCIECGMPYGDHQRLGPHRAGCPGDKTGRFFTARPEVVSPAVRPIPPLGRPTRTAKKIREAKAEARAAVKKLLEEGRRKTAEGSS